MADTVYTFSPSTSVLHDMSKNQNTENVVCQEPSHNGSSLNNTRAPVNIQRQCQSGLMYNMDPTSPFIASQATMTGVQDKINTYTTWSVFNTLCCCWCLGCLACYYSTETGDLKRDGNMQGALIASTKARTVNIIATVIGVIFIIISVFYYALVFQDLS